MLQRHVVEFDDGMLEPSTVACCGCPAQLQCHRKSTRSTPVHSLTVSVRSEGLLAACMLQFGLPVVVLIILVWLSQLSGLSNSPLGTFALIGCFMAATLAMISTRSNWLLAVIAVERTYDSQVKIQLTK